VTSTTARSRGGPDVVVIGSYNASVTLEVERFPRPGETLVAERIDWGPGGKGANQAIGIRRLGVPTLLVASLGPDPLGAQARETLLAERLPAEGLLSGRSPTGLAMILVDATGENIITIAPGANAELDAKSTLDRFGPALQSCRAVVLQLECPLALAATMANWAHEAGKTVILNPAPARPLEPTLLSCVDVLTPNEGELQLLCDHLGLATTATRNETRAASLVELGVGNVVVTLGSRGALWASASGIEHFSSYPVDVVDTTGAGDAFTAGLVAGLVSEQTMRDAIDQGCRAGAFCVTRRGVIDGLARPEDLRALDCAARP
jgi:ribokinase